MADGSTAIIILSYSWYTSTATSRFRREMVKRYAHKDARSILGVGAIASPIELLPNK